MVVPSVSGDLTISHPESAPFIRDFDDAVRETLLRDASMEVVHKGERIIRAGDTPGRLGIVVSGMVEICGTIHDPECGVLFLTSGDLIFPMAVFFEEPSLASATALTRTRLIMLDRKTVVEQATLHADVALGLARVMGGQWRMAVRHIIDLKCRSAAQRLAAFLLKFVDYTDEVPTLPFSKATLAARLGVSRETLSRVIQVVADHGIVLRGSQILVRDREAAENFCGPEPYAQRSERRIDVNAL